MKGLPQLKEWIIRPYGQVEGERQGSVYQYFGSSGTWIKNFSDNTLAALFVAPIFIVIILFILAKLLNHSLIVALRSLGGLALLSFLPLALYCQALFTNGLVDLLRNTLLVLPTLLLVYLVLAAMVLSWLAQKVFSQSRETPGK